MSLHTVSAHGQRGLLLEVPGLCPADLRALTQAVQTDPGACLPKSTALDGRHIALVSSSELDPSADVFTRAALALGARVSRVLPADLGLDQAARAVDTARLLGRLLGRLYASIGCAGLDRQSVALLKRACGVPVLHDLAADTHPSRLLADVMTLKQSWHGVGCPPRPRLGVYGPPQSGLLSAWKMMAAGAGVEVVAVRELSADPHAMGCHFVCRPGRPPELLALAAGGSPNEPHEASLAEQQRSNHGLVIQALLRNQVGTPR